MGMIARTSTVVLLLLAFHLSFAQSQYGGIHVTVLDAQTNQPLPYANVYLSQTTIGGYTNDKGEVEVGKIPFGTHQLVISEIGHVAYQRSLTVQSEEVARITIRLLVKVLDEVQVTGKRDDKWNRQLERFERLFFGAEHFKYCKITNPWVLQFKIEGGDFIAEATEPLKIENSFLGYNLDFNMKSCFFSATNFAITGTTRFEEKQGDQSTVIKWKENRENIYRGSPQHFFRAAVNGSVSSEGYNVYTDISRKEKITRGSTLSSNINFTIVRDSLTGRVKKSINQLYSINLPSRLEVHYLRKRARISAYTDVGNPITWIEVKKGPLIVNRQGVIQNTDNITLAGSMSDMRVAEWLPLNYQSSGTDGNVRIAGPSTVKKDLREKPYIQTDRSYYYNGETIWLKGYMSYSVPVLRDTLSRTIYIELVDRNGQAVVNKRYPIENGRFQGDIALGRALKPGLYQLKAYTAWMLNFDTRLIFTTTIQVLTEKEAVTGVQGYTPSTDILPNISIQTDKDSYSAREKVIVTIDVMDSVDFRTASDLSIAVTDLDQAVPVRSAKTILTNFRYMDKYASDSIIKVKSNIEYGIDFKGRLLSGSKPAQGNLTVYQRNSAENFEIVTDNAGRFRRNLLFNDTIDFYIKAVSSNNKKSIVVMDTLQPRSPQLTFDPLPLEVYSSESNKRVAGLNLNSTTILKEVAVTGKKIEKASSPSTIYGSPDYTIDGAWIIESNYLDIFQAIASKVSGLQYNPSPPSVKFMSAQFSSFGGGNGGGGPLIMVDGVTMNESQALTVPIKSISRVDVLKFGSTASFGTRGGNGVIAIYTGTGIPKSFEKQAFDNRKLQAIKWSGYTSTSAFTSPDYSAPSTDDYFDYRATIYWSPSVLTDGKDPATVTFYAADVATKYRIVVEGVTIEGVPVRAEKIIEIVKGN